MNASILWYVSGRVQGVGFRWYVREAAQRLGVCGDVRNLDDGRVQVRAVGESDTLDALKREVERGPGFVSGIEAGDVEPGYDPQGSEITR